jgi:hypothetical protein
MDELGHPSKLPLRLEAHPGHAGLQRSALGQSRRLQQIAEMSGFLPIAIIGPPTVADK